MNEALLTDQKKRPARARILLTAHDLFYREGIRATGIDRIIAEAGVTKVTFYRHFPSKNDLIRAFLIDRHERWMTWFKESLQNNGAYNGQGVAALVPVLAEWFFGRTFRGCAFINTVVELGPILPEVVEVSQSHKREMAQVIANLLPASDHREVDAEAIAMAIDGAIVKVQCGEPAKIVQNALARLLQAIQAKTS